MRSAANRASPIDDGKSRRKVSPMSDSFESIRVIDEPTAIEIVGVSPRTWDRMRARGELPPKTRLSTNRIGYRLIDIKEWLDRRREAAA